MGSSGRSASILGRAVLGELLRPPQELSVAEAILTARCMQREGFRYPRLEAVRRAWKKPSTPVGALVGAEPLSLEEAQKHGYRYRINPQPPPAEDADVLEERYLETLTEERARAYSEALAPSKSDVAQLELFDGMTVEAATTGCVAFARAALFSSARDFLRWYFIPQGIWRLGRADPEDDPAVQAAGKQYVAGMRSAGYKVDGPGQATRAAAERFGLGWQQPSAEECAMAAADAEWQARSRLHEVLDDQQLQDAADWVTTHLGELEQLRDLQHDAMKRALQIIGSGGDHRWA